MKMIHWPLQENPLIEAFVAQPSVPELLCFLAFGSHRVENAINGLARDSSLWPTSVSKDSHVA